MPFQIKAKTIKPWSSDPLFHPTFTEQRLITMSSNPTLCSCEALYGGPKTFCANRVLKRRRRRRKEKRETLND